MPQQFWVDSCSMIQPSKEAYSFSLVPQYWVFLHEKAKAGVLACPELVFEELCGTQPKKMDELELWARSLHDTLFVSPSEENQRAHTKVVDWVENNQRFKSQHTSSFSLGPTAGSSPMQECLEGAS